MHREIVPVAFDDGRGLRDLELRLAASATVAELIGAVAGGDAGGLWIDGRRVDLDQPVSEVGLRPGSLLTLADRADQPVVGAVVELRVVGGIAAGGTSVLAPGRWLLGRGAGAGTDVDLGSATVSARHAVLVVDALGSVTIEDLRSHNGTRLEGEFIAPGTRVVVPHGAVVTLGAVNVVVASIEDRSDPPPGAVVLNRPPRPTATNPPRTVPVPEAAGEPAARARLPIAAIVAPVVMGAVLAVLWDPRMALFALLTPIGMLGTWLEDRRRHARDRRSGAATTERDLVRFAAALDAAAGEEVERRRHSLPDLAAVTTRAATLAASLWERRPVHDDFLQLRVGTADVRWTPPLGDTARPADGVADVVAERSVLRRAPFAVDLRPGRVLGIVGDDRAVLAALLRSLVVQAASLHGPADLRIGLLTDGTRADEWSFARWLPHAVLGDVDAVVAALSACEGVDRLVVVDADGLTEGRPSPVRSLLAGAAGRVAGIVVAADARRLPAVCTTVLVLEGQDGGGHAVDVATAERTEGVFVDGLDEACAGAAARSMASVEDPEVHDGAAALPHRVGLMALLDVEASAGAIAERWRAPALRTPIGVTEQGPLIVDLVADGPHALVGGTTGAGKSELLRSLVVGLAANAGPQDLNFVLVDYKGGSAFDACARLPHTVGLVTDLDEHLGQRALRCLDAELRYRESVARSAGPSDRPLPRLVVVIDEFATLAAELPDFIDALVGIAQRGRSLGVHLVLATQRPAGAVKDNIRANTNLRIALRMQDAADSTDVLDTPVAASIGRHQAGRGFARLGPGEVRAFQAAIVSGASPRHDAFTGPVEVRRLSGLGAGASSAVDPSTHHGPSDLERLVAAMRGANDALGLPAPRRPWPEPLPTRLDAADLEHVPTAARPTAVFGLADDPARQARRPAVWAAATGNLLLYGVGGSGTTTALTTLARSLAARHGPHALHLYVADLGAGGLATALSDLPHTGATITAGEPERLRRLLRLARGELDRRRRGCGRGVDDPAIVVMIDNWSGFVAAFDDDDLFVRDEVARLVADGPALGVWTIIAADHANAVPTSITNLVTSKLVFRTADRHDAAALGVATGLAPTAIPGRCVDTASGLEVQIALSHGLAPWPGARSAPAIGVLPSDVRVGEVIGVPEGDGLSIDLAVSDATLGTVALILREGEHALVTGPRRSGRSTTLVAIAAVLADRPGVLVHAVAPRSSSPLRRVRGCVDSVDELSFDAAVTHVVLVDDAESVDDPTSRLPGAAHVIAAGRTDALRAAYGHWTRDLRSSRVGIALHAEPEDGELLGAMFPRRRSTWTVPGRGYLVVDGVAELVQVARP